MDLVGDMMMLQFSTRVDDYQHVYSKKAIEKDVVVAQKQQM